MPHFSNFYVWLRYIYSVARNLKTPCFIEWHLVPILHMIYKRGPLMLFHSVKALTKLCFNNFLFLFLWDHCLRHVNLWECQLRYLACLCFMNLEAITSLLVNIVLYPCCYWDFVFLCCLQCYICHHQEIFKDLMCKRQFFLILHTNISLKYLLCNTWS